MATTALALAASSWALLMGIAPVLHIRRILRELSSRDVSVGYFAILLVGFVLWIAYGATAAIPALVIPNGVARPGRGGRGHRGPAPAATDCEETNG